MENSKDNWVIDSGSTNHVCVSLQEFKEMRSLGEYGILLRIGGGTLVSVIAVRDVHIYFHVSRFILFKDYFYVPSVTSNIISIPCLDGSDFLLYF